VLCAVGAFGLALFIYMDVSMFGFPDGYVTDYQQAAGRPLRIAAWALGGFGLLLLALAFSPISTRARTFGWVAALVGFVAVAVAAKIGVPWYFGTHLGLDNGIGG
jgi:hypothetical protein